MLDLALLRSFSIVARTGSISLAASQIGRTQSALSMQMRRLEGVVGKPLLLRTGSGMMLTAQGERLLLHAELLLARHDDILAEMSGADVRGPLTLGCPEDYSIAFVPDLLRSFCARHPQVELRMVCAPTTDLRPLLKRRQIDIALVSLPDPGDAKVIRREDFVWVAHEPQPSLLGQDSLPLALSAPSTLDYRAACRVMDAVGRRYRIAFASDSFAGLVAIARSGHAISVLTRTAVPADLHVIDALPRLPTIGIAIELAEASPPRAVRALADHIRQRLPGLGMPRF